MWNLRVCIFVILGIISSIFLVISFPIFLVIWCFFYLTFVVSSMLIGGTLTILLWYIWNFIQENLLTRTFRGSTVSMLLYILFPKQMIHIFQNFYYRNLCGKNKRNQLSSIMQESQGSP